ncbi:MAG: DUF1223 domain-containing protein [Brachymonas sp.]|nr:DUF1223 domain-containing protein [Brachymonas sp.]
MIASRPTLISIALSAVFLPASAVFSMESCSVKSSNTLTPVVELYTSEGCSSCPPADAWLSTLKMAHKEGKVVAQAFHVNYWDYIGWKDRFAAPIYTQRQRELSARTHLNSIYTPQIAKNGITVRDVGSSSALIAAKETAQASIALKQLEANRFEAAIEPAAHLGATPWTAYFTVTEHEHLSKVTAGENKGETLTNDFVVRQYVPLGQFSGAQTLKFSSLAPTITSGKTHPRQINVVITDAKTGKTMQAISLGC